MTALDLAALRKLHAEATQGEYKQDGKFVNADGDNALYAYRGEDDAACAAALHNAFPSLADRIERLEDRERRASRVVRAVIALRCPGTEGARRTWTDELEAALAALEDR